MGQELLCTRSRTFRLQKPALFGKTVIVYTVWVRSAQGAGPVWDKSYCVHGLGSFGAGSRFYLGQELLCTRFGTFRLQKPALFGTTVIVYTVWVRSAQGAGLVWDKRYCVHGLGPFNSRSRPCLEPKLFCTRSKTVQFQWLALFGTKIIVYSVLDRSAPGTLSSGRYALQSKNFFMTYGGPLHTPRNDRGFDVISWVVRSW